MKVISPLTFEISGEPFLLEKRIRLLHAIEEHGSISKAAKAVPMSYKSAWEAVDTMNSLSPEPIVYRETGGKDGGGTTVTAYGRSLLENFALLKSEHSRFLERLSQLTNLQSGEFQTIGRFGLQISARNQIQAEVTGIESSAVNARVSLQLKSGQELLSVITEEAVENLQIEEGQTVIAICKSSSVSVTLSCDETGRDNWLEGLVRRIERDEENVKIEVDIGRHDKIISVMPLDRVEKMTLVTGQAVFARVKSNEVMIGK